MCWDSKDTLSFMSAARCQLIALNKCKHQSLPFLCVVDTLSWLRCLRHERHVFVYGVYIFSGNIALVGGWGGGARCYSV